MAAVNKGIVKLSSSFKGSISKTEAKSAKKKEIEMAKKLALPKVSENIPREIRKVAKKKAAEPSKLLCSTILLFPNRIPITALRGSAIANV